MRKKAACPDSALMEFLGQGKRFFTIEVVDAPRTPLKRKNPICTQPEKRGEKTEKINSPKAMTKIDST